MDIVQLLGQGRTNNYALAQLAASRSCNHDNNHTASITHEHPQHRPIAAARHSEVRKMAYNASLRRQQNSASGSGQPVRRNAKHPTTVMLARGSTAAASCK